MVNIQNNLKRNSVKLANLEQSDFFEFQGCIWQVLFVDEGINEYSCYNYNKKGECALFAIEEVLPLDVTSLLMDIVRKNKQKILACLFSLQLKINRTVIVRFSF